MQQQLLLEYNKGGSSHLGDRISLLPDDIIILILSFLSRKEAAATSLLSRRWRHMWAFTKRLKFVVKDWRSECLHSNMKWSSKRFVKEVNQVLRLHKGSALEEFGLSFCLNENFKQEIDNWLKLASAKRVQKLELDFYAPVRCSADNTVGNYNLSYGVVNQNNGTSSKTMSSSLCMIECRQFAGFASLKVLCLRSVNVTGEILEGFLSCCPSLEKLTVEDSRTWGLVHLKVQGPSLALKYLEIKTCPCLSAVEICNVNLVTLVYVGRNISWVLHNTPVLVNLTIGGGACAPLSRLWFSQLSHCLSQLETLTIGYTEISEVRVGDVPFELSNLKNLNLNVLMEGDRSVLGFMPLIKASPNLQRFVFKSKWFLPTLERWEIRRVEKLPLKHIEEIEFRGYYGNTSHLEILAFFLENAVSVKKVIVDPNKVYNPETYRGADPETKRSKRKVKAARGRAMRQLEGMGIMLQGAEIKIL